MLKNLAAAVVCAATVVLPVVAANPAQADTPDCVAKKEFKRVKNGWSITRVKNVFDVGGSQAYYSGAMPALDIPASQLREYKPCQRYSYVSVEFEKKHGVWKVTHKQAFWG